MKENKELMQKIASLEDYYWWYTGRREIIRNLFRSLLTGRSRVLNLGCGIGSDSRCASEFAEVFNIDYSLAALTLCRQKGNTRILQADCSQIPIKKASFDMVLCLDVLEHVQNELEVLAEIRKVLKPENGRMLLTAPAFKWMWSSRDEFAGHLRRYSINSLNDVLIQGGFETIFSSYFNTLLFPLTLVDLLLDRVRKPRLTRNFFPEIGKKTNSLLRKIFALERYFILKPGLPFGRSLICLCRPTKS